MEEADKPRSLRVVGKIDAKPAPETVTLAGRMFTVLPGPTIEGRQHWARCLRKGGLGALAPGPGETAKVFRARVADRVLESNVAYRLMATRIVPLQEGWTPEKAGLTAESSDETTAEFISRLTGPDELEIVRGLFDRIVEAIIESAVAP